MMSSSGSSSWRSSSGSSAKGNEAQYCETICKMLTMLSCSEKMDAHRALLTMTNSPESCQSLRRAGCIPLLIQILHPGSNTDPGSHPSAETKLRASKALKNIVHFNPDDKLKRKELRVLRLLECIREFTNSTTNPSESEKHPTSSLTALMKLSFDAEHRGTMCTLGTIYALADLISSDHKVHGPQPTDADCILTRNYSCVTLTNLTLVDTLSKAMLCSMNEFLTSLVSQLECENEDIVQVTASILRNLSSHADSSSRDALQIAVNGLIKAALKVTKEPTLKATLSALCYLSAHSIKNRATICSTPNALNFLLSLLRRNKPIPIVENAGGILRNISSHVAGVEAYRMILKECHCFEILLDHLRSSSLTIVSNACGILCSLSGNEEMLHIWTKESPILSNAVPLLKSLEYSKNERISQVARAALLNLRTYCNQQTKDSRQSYDSDNDQPLDLTTSCKANAPVRKLNPPFLNPPIYNGSVSSTRTCPDIQSDLQVKSQKMEASTDETFNYSHYDEEEDEEEEKNQQKDTITTYCYEGTPGFSGSGSMVDLSNQAFDTFIQFQVENTPAVFSRTSSLSSIDENPSNQIITDEKKPVPNVQLSSAAVPTVVVPKRVMFNPEETPLMFSRCSSCGSLESCGDLNHGPCESDCVSEFSRRTSAVVSPSELPDSPRGFFATQDSTQACVTTTRESVVNPEGSDQSIAGQPDETEFTEEVESKSKPPATTSDELKVFAMEGTPFLISTATSLSDIVGELDNQVITPFHHQVIPEEPPPVKIQSPPLAVVDPDPDDPIYSDIQLLQKCIKAGRAVGLAKKPVVEEDDEVDLSHLIQRGRAKLLTRSEDNLKQYTNNSGPLLSKPISTLPVINGMRKPQTDTVNPQLSQQGDINVMSKSKKTPDKVSSSQPITVDTLSAKVSNINLNSSPVQNSIQVNDSSLHVNNLNSDKIDNNKREVTAGIKQKDNIVDEKLHHDDRWTNHFERSSLCSSSPSLSTIKAMKITNNRAEETTMSDIEQSNSVISSTSNVDMCQKQSLLLQGNSSQVTNFNNFKKPTEGVDIVNKMSSSSSSSTGNIIKSEMDDNPPPLSVHMSSSSSSQSSTSCNHSHAMRMPNPDLTNFTPHPPNRSSSAQSKYDKYSVKRVESPKERRKNDPDRYMTRSIDKFDLKTNRPAIPPKPSSSASNVRPTRTSANHSREHSPTNSTASLKTTGGSGGGNKIPPKPPVRSTPPLNTTLPRNTKLMEGHSSTISQELHGGHGSTKGNSVMSLEPKQSQQLPQLPILLQPPTPPPKLNFGGRLGNLFHFRKSFSKDSDKGSKKKDIWVKRREKALIPPFNYKPPSQSNEDGLNGNTLGGSIGNGIMNQTTTNSYAPPTSLSNGSSSKPTTITTTTTMNNNSGSSNGQTNGKSSTKITRV